MASADQSDASGTGGPPRSGEQASDFTLPDQRGALFTLSEHRGRHVLVYFYPKANTPGCTTQACGLRDISDQIGDTVIVGISPDPPSRLASFDTKFGLGFTLCSDLDHGVALAYGAWGPKKLYGREYEGIIRSAVLVDPEGVVTRVWPKISPKDTPLQLLEALGGG